MTVATQRFMRKGVTKFYFVTAIAAFPTVSHTEAIAGVDVTPQLATITGFNFANTPIKTPNMKDVFTPEIPGEDTAAASSLEFYELKGGTTEPIHDALPKNATGWILAFAEGLAGGAPALGDRCDAWPVTVSANSRQYNAGNQAAMYKVDFSITAPPALDTVLT